MFEFNEKAGSNLTQVVNFGIEELESGLQVFDIHFVPSPGRNPQRYRDFINVPKCWETRDEKIDKWPKRMAEHLINRYFKFFANYHSEDTMKLVVEDKFVKHMVKFFDGRTKSFIFSEFREDVEGFRNSLRLTLIAIIHELSSMVPDEQKQKSFYTWRGYTKGKNKFNYGPVDPHKLIVLNRFSMLNGEIVSPETKDAVSGISWKETKMNAQYPFQKDAHNPDVVGRLWKSIVNPNGQDGFISSNLNNGECHPKTWTALLDRQIITRNEYDLQEAQNATIEADVPVPQPKTTPDW